jgi:hypothetical protein
MSKEIDIEINVKPDLTGIAKLKSELKSLKGQLAEATDPADIERLSKAAGDLSDQLKDVNERIAVFASGSGFEQVANGLGLIGNQLGSLDFKGAAESAKLLTTTIKGLDPKEVKEQFKGLVSTIGQLSKAFIQMGIKLLANPLFLITAIIASVIGVIIMLKDKIKIMEKAFDLLMIPINALIDGLKMFGDWLGLTSFAADEVAEKHIKANDKLVASYKKREEKLTEQFDREIRISKINGDDTTKLEIEKQRMIAELADKRVKANQESLDEIKDRMQRSTREQKKELKEQYDNLVSSIQDDKKLRSDSNFEVKAIKAQAVVDDKAAEEKAQADSVAKHKEYLQKRAEAERLHVETLRKIKDISLSLLDEGLAKDKAIADETYKRNLEDLEKTKIIEADKANLRAAYLAQKKAALKKADDDETARAETKQKDQDAKDAEKIVKEDAQFALLQEATLTKDEWEIAQLVASYEAKFALAEGNAELEKALQEQLNTELGVINQTHRDKEALSEKELNEKKYDAVRSSFETIGNLAVLFAGKSEKQQRAAFKVQQAANIAGATMDTYKAATGAYASLSGIPTVGPVLGSLAAAAAISAGLVNIKNIAGQKFGSTSTPSAGGGNTSLATPSTSTPSSQPLQPSFNLFGRGNQLNTATGSAPANANQNITVTAIVSETEVTSTQQKVQQLQDASKL